MQALELLQEAVEWSQISSWIDLEPLWAHPRFRMMWPHEYVAPAERVTGGR